MIETKQEQWDRRLTDMLKRIKRLHNLHAPDCIIVNELALLHKYAVAHLGREYLDKINQEQIRAYRMYCGLCIDCGEPLLDFRSRAVQCPKCIAIETTEDFKCLVEYDSDEVTPEEQAMAEEAMQETDGEDNDES